MKQYFFAIPATFCIEANNEDEAREKAWDYIHHYMSKMFDTEGMELELIEWCE